MKVDELTPKQFKKYWKEYTQTEEYQKIFKLERFVRLDGIQITVFENWLNKKLDK